MLFNDTTTKRFWAKVDKNGPNGCWLWTAAKLQGPGGGRGYGVFGIKGKNKPAHRVAYEILVGPIPDGLTLDHLCRVRHCVNPHHLEPVTNRENVLRGVGITARLHRQTHCKRGHPFDENNTYINPSGYRQCKACWQVRLDLRDADNIRAYKREWARNDRKKKRLLT